MIYLLSFFYLRDEVGFRVGMFASAAPLASTFAGALAYGITREHSSFHPWRLLFLVEGLPTLLMIPFAYLFIPDSPDTARFLTREEKQIARARAIRQAGVGERVGSIDWRQVFKAACSPVVWCQGVCYLSTCPPNLRWAILGATSARPMELTDHSHLMFTVDVLRRQRLLR